MTQDLFVNEISSKQRPLLKSCWIVLTIYILIMTNLTNATNVKDRVQKSVEDSVKKNSQKLNIFKSLNYPDAVNVIRRDEWGWRTIDRNYRKHIPKFITIHHGGVKISKDIDSLEHVKNLQTWSRGTKHWIDIPYHFMIDPKGLIYETRPINIPGDTNTEYDTAGHILIELMGNFEEQDVEAKQLKSLVMLSRFLLEQFQIDIKAIKGHLDYSNQTVCPGKNLYGYIETGELNKLIKQ